MPTMMQPTYDEMLPSDLKTLEGASGDGLVVRFAGFGTRAEIGRPSAVSMKRSHRTLFLLFWHRRGKVCHGIGHP